MGHLIKYIKPFLPKMAVGFTIKFIGTIMDLVLPMMLAYMIDDIVPLRSMPLIWAAGAVMVVCSVIAIWGNITANRIAARVARDTTEKIRNDLFTRISYLSARQLDTFTIPSLESRLTSDTYNIHQMVGMLQRLGVRAPLLLVGGLIVTFILEPVLTMVLVAILPFIGITVYVISKRGIPLFTGQQEATDEMTRVVRENAQGVRIIKALHKEEAEKIRFDDTNAELNRREKRAAENMALTSPLMNLFLNCGLVAVILVGALRVNGGVSEPGKIIAFMSYFTIILNAMMSVTRMFIMSSKGIASANRIGEVLDAPEDMAADPAYAGEADASAPKIVFENVSFSYNGVKDNLSDISFSMEKGQTLGIIGPTGSGKTTLISLLMRQYDVNAGSIRLDGVDVRGMEKKTISKKFGAAFQNDFLFADTIEANIDFGRGLTMEEMEEGASVAQAMDFIKEKDGGFGHELTIKGANLSGGQKQRVILSRALSGSPEILVLDDSSSALDYATDARLRKAIRERYDGREDERPTTIIVAQRVSSIRHADLILVLEDGRITGRGTHDELMQSCPLYAEIAASQMGGALLE
ncbi:MAG: ABC transporter ATP-binding protein [Ruminococcaceae bacterium]|nr:ABC transporter ATP-binding protein [Oscillospiraceae bacterium]